MYSIGQRYARRICGIEKQAAPNPAANENVVDNVLRRLARGRSRVPLETIPPPTLPELLIGRPQEVLKPRRLFGQVASLTPTRKAILALQGLGPEGTQALARLKGLGGLGVDLLHKGLVFGIPAYLIHKALQKPAPGKTRGEEVGHAVGQSLGWLPPMGVAGTAATVAAPEYSLPGLLGTLGEHAGGAVSQLVGERPTPLGDLPIHVRTAT
jgi:hypothetical protein